MDHPRVFQPTNRLQQDHPMLVVRTFFACMATGITRIPGHRPSFLWTGLLEMKMKEISSTPLCWPRTDYQCETTVSRSLLMVPNQVPSPCAQPLYVQWNSDPLHELHIDRSGRRVRRSKMPNEADQPNVDRAGWSNFLAWTWKRGTPAESQSAQRFRRNFPTPSSCSSPDERAHLERNPVTLEPQHHSR